MMQRIDGLSVTSVLMSFGYLSTLPALSYLVVAEDILITTLRHTLLIYSALIRLWDFLAVSLRMYFST